MSDDASKKTPQNPYSRRASISSDSPQASRPKTSAEYLAEGLIKTLAPSSPPSPVLISAADPKPGWYTSEFWLTALVIVGVFVSLILGRITVTDIANLWPLFTGPAAYALSRGIAKKGT